jgi:hypothetical protein
MQKLFVTAQEAKRKDIERAFGILQARFHVLTSGCRLWDRGAMDTVIRTCVILHNLVIDYKCEHNMDGNYINDENYVPLHNMVVVPCNSNQNHVNREIMIDDMQNTEQWWRGGNSGLQNMATTIWIWTMLCKGIILVALGQHHGFDIDDIVLNS